MDASKFVGDLLKSMQPAIERRGRKMHHDDLFGEVGLAWADLE